jgi:tRNA(Ile)-lysidine synthase
MTEADLDKVIAAEFLPVLPDKIGVAVSGGGDSMALLVLMAKFAAQNDVDLHAISVDHGLRAEATQEIQLVAQLCASLGIAHSVEHWTGWDGAGNLQSKARDARYELISKWAKRNGIASVALGHTANDQAETLLMRLARGAGVDGLAAMAPRRVWQDISWLRPLLGVEREILREYLRQKDLVWAEDPSNENRDFVRIRMRDALDLLAPFGIAAQGLSKVADNLGDARAALEYYTSAAANDACQIVHGGVVIDRVALENLPTEIARRLLVRAVMWVNNADYAPRRSAVSSALNAIKTGVSATLDGCQVTTKRQHIYVFRELNAVSGQTCTVGDIWDGRWRLDGSEAQGGYTVRALGITGIKETDGWRDLGLPREAVLSLPSVWSGNELAIVPAINTPPKWHAELVRPADTFFATLLSH